MSNKWQYREDVVKEFGDKVTTDLENYFEGVLKNDCYVRHATNGKPVVVGPFRSFIQGYFYGSGLPTLESRLLEWHTQGPTGISSLTIASILSGKNLMKKPFDKFDIPYDPSDFNRCVKLLEVFPEWVPRLKEVSKKFKKFKPFAENWDQLMELYNQEKNQESAPLLYQYMRTLRGEK